jgi:hypothetical protein
VLEYGNFDNVNQEGKDSCPKSAPPITSNGRGAIAIPRFAGVEQINRSTTDESTSMSLTGSTTETDDFDLHTSLLDCRTR